jgi:cell division protein FtsZ
MADEVLYSGVRGVTDLIVMPGLINLDFADIRSVMEEMGKAMMGTGEASGDRRALDAAEAAIANPLLEDMSMKGAKGVLINITGGLDVTLFEVDEAATRIRAEVDADAHIIVGSAFDPNLDGTMRVSVVATGIDANSSRIPAPTMLNLTTIDQQSVGEQIKVLELEEPVQKSLDAMERVVEENIETKEVNALEETDASLHEPLLEANNTNSDDLLTVQQTKMPEIEPESKTDQGTDFEKEAVVVQEDIAPMVHGMGITDAFIPPKPVVVESMVEKNQAEPLLFSDKESVVTPQNITSAETPEAAIKPSLFERVTRTGRAATGFVDNTYQMTEARVPLAPENTGKKQEKKFTESINADSVLTPEIDSNEPAQQTKLVGLEPHSEPKREEAKSEDDMLDIPAFLRRQAN